MVHCTPRCLQRVFCAVEFYTFVLRGRISRVNSQLPATAAAVAINSCISDKMVQRQASLTFPEAFKNVSPIWVLLLHNLLKPCWEPIWKLWRENIPLSLTDWETKMKNSTWIGNIRRVQYGATTGVSQERGWRLTWQNTLTHAHSQRHLSPGKLQSERFWHNDLTLRLLNC